MARLKADEDGDVSPVGEFEAPEGLCVVGEYLTPLEANEAGLVILAMGNAYWTLLHDTRYYLCVSETREKAVREELATYAALIRNRRESKARPYHEFSFGWISFVGYAVVLIGFFIAQQRIELTEIGHTDSLRILAEGEWWRALTALTLHADVVHLVSNLVSGLGFAYFVCRFFGAASGWLLILLSGIGGNVLNAWVYYPEAHAAIGASTAVFGALGLLTGVGFWAALWQPEQRLALPRWMIPIFGGLTLFGLFGLGEGNIDVAGHISGFLVGSLFGVAGAAIQPWFVRWQRGGVLIGLIVIGLLSGGWLWAYQTL